MKTVAFLLGSPEISGGTNVIYEHASRLNRGGFGVTILTEKPVSAEKYDWHPEARWLNWSTFGEAIDFQFDFVIATWWQSVFDLERVRGRYYVYFVQSIESRFFQERDPADPDKRDADIVAGWCQSTYRYPLPVITEARWIKKYLQQRYNKQSHLVLNGIRKDVFCEKGVTESPRKPSKLRVLVEGPLGVFFKNVEKTIELCRKASMDEIWLLTSSDVSDYPGVDRCFSRVAIEKTPEIYRSCDVLVKLSYVEGMFGPPLEMFHCGGTAIVYNVTGHDEYIKDGKNGIVLKKDDEEGVIQWLQRLKGDRELLAALQAGARKTAEEWWDWEAAAATFGRSLLDIEKASAGHEKYFLKEYNELSLFSRDNAFKARELLRYAEREGRITGDAGNTVNFVQVYWNEGYGLSPAIQKEYFCGEWQYCQIDVPVKSAPVTLRIDPSVRIGIVAVKNLEVIDKATGKVLRSYKESHEWRKVFFSGTMVCLQKEPYPVLHAFGEDPQMILPDIEQVGDDGIRVNLEVLEMSFSEHFYRFSSFIEENRSLKNQMKKMYTKLKSKFSLLSVQ